MFRVIIKVMERFGYWLTLPMSGSIGSSSRSFPLHFFLSFSRLRLLDLRLRLSSLSRDLDLFLRLSRSRLRDLDLSRDLLLLLLWNKKEKMQVNSINIYIWTCIFKSIIWEYSIYGIHVYQPTIKRTIF